jgi:hypothetical protein
MILPTLEVTIRRTVGHDLYGQPKWSIPIKEMVAPVRLERSTRNTTVRTDSGATHGHAYETESKAKLLFQSSSSVTRGDRIEVLGNRLRVMSVHPRFTVAGKLDHFEVELETWV